MGVSFGGMVGQEFVLRHPDRVSKLVLVAPLRGQGAPLIRFMKLKS